MAATASRLTSLSRRWTAERGLSGFTIDELCEEAGIARRTFFNYFPSKEEAVLGVDETDEAQRFAEMFLERGSRGWPSVIDDLVELGVEFAESLDFGSTDHTDFIAALEREPKLLARALGMNREREVQLTELVATREGTPSADPHVRAAVNLFSTMARSAVESLLAQEGNDFRAALTTSLAALRDVLAAPTDRKDHQ